MLSFLAVNFRLASRSSLALLNASNFTISAHKHSILSQNTLTRSFIASSRVSFAPEVKSGHEEDSKKIEKKPKKRATSKAKKASAPERDQKFKVTKKPKSKPEPKPEKSETLPVPTCG